VLYCAVEQLRSAHPSGSLWLISQPPAMRGGGLSSVTALAGSLTVIHRPGPFAAGDELWFGGSACTVVRDDGGPEVQIEIPHRTKSRIDATTRPMASRALLIAENLFQVADAAGIKI
jgi:hypothetical protein